MKATITSLPNSRLLGALAKACDGGSVNPLLAHLVLRATDGAEGRGD